MAVAAVNQTTKPKYIASRVMPISCLVDECKTNSALLIEQKINIISDNL